MQGPKRTRTGVDGKVDATLETQANAFLSTPSSDELDDFPDKIIAQLAEFGSAKLAPILAEKCLCEPDTTAAESTFFFRSIDAKASDASLRCRPREFLLRFNMDVKEHLAKPGVTWSDAGLQHHVLLNMSIMLAHAMDMHRSASGIDEVHRVVKLTLTFVKLRVGGKIAKSVAVRCLARVMLSYELDMVEAEKGMIGVSTAEDQKKYLGEKRGERGEL